MDAADRLRIALGPRAERYLRRFERIERAGRGWLPGWNMAAFLHSTGWFCYRRMYAWALLNLLAPFLLLYALVLAGIMIFPGANLDVAMSILAIAYLVAVFVAVPMFADAVYYRHLRSRLAKFAESSESGGTAPRPPSALTTLAAVALGAAWLVPVGAIMMIDFAYRDYVPRAKVKEAIGIAGVMKTEIAEFHAEHGRLPGPAEADKLGSKTPSSQWVQSIAYDPGRRMIVITMRDPFPGKRFALHAEEREGNLSWTCRTIDLDPKVLPPTCRQ